MTVGHIERYPYIILRTFSRNVLCLRHNFFMYKIMPYLVPGILDVLLIRDGPQPSLCHNRFLAMPREFLRSWTRMFDRALLMQYHTHAVPSFLFLFWLLPEIYDRCSNSKMEEIDQNSKKTLTRPALCNLVRALQIQG